ATVADSVANDNGGAGFVASVGANVAIVNSRAVHNAVAGVETALSGTKLSLANTTILGNTKGFVVGTAGTMFTFGNNYIVDTSNTGVLSTRRAKAALRPVVSRLSTGAKDSACTGAT